MSETNNTAAFAAAALVQVKSADITVQPRTARLPLPLFFHFASADNGLAAGAELTDDFEQRHQVEYKRPSSYAPRMPNVELAKSGKNPYADISVTDLMLTKDKYKHLAAVLPHVWDVLSKSKAPLTASEVATAIAKRHKEIGNVKWFNECVRDTLIDLSIYGLASRDAVKVNAKATRFVANDPATIEVVAK